MRAALLDNVKIEIENNLRSFLREEGVELRIASNDNVDSDKEPLVELEAFESHCLEGCALLSEIKIILGILGRPWQCEMLIKGIYEALLPHRITRKELTVLLMSIHVESLHCVRPRRTKKRAVMRYIVEENDASVFSVNDDQPESATFKKTEYC